MLVVDQFLARLCIFKRCPSSIGFTLERTFGRKSMWPKSLPRCLSSSTWAGCPKPCRVALLLLLLLPSCYCCYYTSALSLLLLFSLLPSHCCYCFTAALSLLRRRHFCTCILAATCPFYTSDAADEEDCVDLGGRRIIKKKKRTLLFDWVTLLRISTTTVYIVWTSYS